MGDNLDRLVQPAVLAVLANEKLHGYRIVDRMSRMGVFAGHQPDVTGVYRFLRLMERRKLVASSWEVSSAGPAKRLYRLTAAGRKCLTAWVGTLESYRNDIGKLLAVARRSLRARPAGACRCRRKPAPRRAKPDSPLKKGVCRVAGETPSTLSQRAIEV